MTMGQGGSSTKLGFFNRDINFRQPAGALGHRATIQTKPRKSLVTKDPNQATESSVDPEEEEQRFDN